jgi:hypothetical protein
VGGNQAEDFSMRVLPSAAPSTSKCKAHCLDGQSEPTVPEYSIMDNCGMSQAGDQKAGDGNLYSIRTLKRLVNILEPLLASNEEGASREVSGNLANTTAIPFFFKHLHVLGKMSHISGINMT